MRDDSLVEEARRAGQKYIDSFKGDWSAVIADLRRRAKEEGRQVVSLSPKRAKHQPTPARKVG